MSFAYDVKKELCGISEVDYSKVRAEYYGMLLFSRKFSAENIIFTTENKYVANRFTNFSTALFSVMIEKQTSLKVKKSNNSLNTLSFIDSNECEKVFKNFGHSNNEVNLRLNRANIENDDDLAAFIRGTFLSCGSVTDPQKNYHLEFCVPHKNLCMDLCKLIEEIPQCVIEPKMINRSGVYVAYIKDSEEITDMLTYMGAFNCAMNIMGTKAIKQVRNNVNRRANSEIANISRTANAAAVHINAINLIEKKYGLDYLPPDLREVAILRLENPDMSLRAIGQALSVPISRSGVNHRIEKILDIAKSIK